MVVQLKWWHQFEFAGYYAADIKGYYAEKGLAVTLKPGDRNHSPAHEVLMKRAHFGITDCSLLVNYAKGEKVVAVSALFQHSPYILISMPYQNIYSPTDLVGKKIMGSDDFGWTQIRAMLLKEGISLDSITKIEHTWKIKHLIKGDVDAMIGYVTTEPFQFQKLGIDVTYIDPTNYGLDFYGDILFTNQQILTENVSLVEDFRAASIKGWKYAMDHPGEMADYILTLPGVVKRGVTKEALLFEAAQMRKLMIPELVETGHMNLVRWENILSTYERLNIIKPGTNLDKFIYNHEDNKIHNLVKNIIYFSIAILLIIAAIVLYSLSLKKAVSNRTRQLKNEMITGDETREKLMLSEERLDLATEAAGIGIWDWNLQDNSVYLSDMWKRMLGYEPGELPDNLETFFQLIHPDDRKEILNNETLHIEGIIEKLQFICRMRTKTGSYKWILSISRAGNRNEIGRATRIIGIHLDVDEIKNKEIALNQLSQELLVSNKELKQFAYITSHNLRAPVANLLMLMELFKRDELSDKNRLLFDKTDQSIKQLNQTLEDLNEILSARFNKTDRAEEVEFETVLLEVINSISEDIDQSNADITYNFIQAPKIAYSKKALHSIFLNLITNAIKYAKPGQRPSLYMTTHQQKDILTLRARDQGIGIDLEKHGKKIFGLYQRFHNVSSGKGLGLYIIKNQVEAQNGSIEVASKVGEGATFTINFKKTTIIDEEFADKNFANR